MSDPAALPDKAFFRIGEVAELVGVEPHVLRYWETEFRALRPKKTRGGHRHYARRDVEIAMRIRQLVHDQGFTIAGAKRRLKELREHRRGDAPAPAAVRELAYRTELLRLRDELGAFLEELDAEDFGENEPKTVRVERVVQSARPPTER